MDGVSQLLMLSRACNPELPGAQDMCPLTFICGLSFPKLAVWSGCLPTCLLLLYGFSKQGFSVCSPGCPNLSRLALSLVGSAPFGYSVSVPS